jgi:hypothetical protein
MLCTSGDAIHLNAFVLSEKSCTTHIVIRSECAWMSGSLFDVSISPAIIESTA